LKYTDPRSFRLQERYSAIKQRCENPNNANWDNYGGRGIKNFFTSPEEFVNYILTELPHKDYKGVDIGQKDNDGHYQKGNLAIESRAVNQRNKRTNRWIDYKGEKVVMTDLNERLKKDYPEFKLSWTHTCRLAFWGVPWQLILKRKPRGPYKKKSSISSTQDHATASR